MKRITAAKRIKAHLRDYRNALRINNDTSLKNYRARDTDTCPLCRACKYIVVEGRGGRQKLPNCDRCLLWPGERKVESIVTDTPCEDFMIRIDELKTVCGKLFWIDKLEAELDRWASEEKS